MAETDFLPLVIPPSRMVRLGAQRLRQDRLTVEIQTQSLADVRAMLRNITTAVMLEQKQIGNPATVVEVDKGQTASLEQIDRIAVVLFGVVLAQAAMREVETALRQAIDRSTVARSGLLHDVTSGWQWRYVPANGVARVVSSSQVLPAFGPGDKLVLRPEHVPYATSVNTLVARSGRLNVMPKPGKHPPKSRQNKGFLFTAAEDLRRRVAFKQFNVRVVFSAAHPVPGETMKRHRSGMIVITPRARAGG